LKPGSSLLAVLNSGLAWWRRADSRATATSTALFTEAAVGAPYGLCALPGPPARPCRDTTDRLVPKVGATGHPVAGAARHNRPECRWQCHCEVERGRCSGRPSVSAPSQQPGQTVSVVPATMPEATNGPPLVSPNAGIAAGRPPRTANRAPGRRLGVCEGRGHVVMAPSLDVPGWNEARTPGL
jgi:hypothetical protein